MQRSRGAVANLARVIGQEGSAPAESPVNDCRSDISGCGACRALPLPPTPFPIATAPAQPSPRPGKRDVGAHPHGFRARQRPGLWWRG